MNVEGRKQPIFGKWEIVEKIGEGAFGAVYKIKRESFGKTYYSALKVIKIPQDEGEIKSLRNELGNDESVSNYYTNFVQDFAKEIEVMAELKGNSNIVSFEDHDFIQNEDGVGWTILIRMELLTPFVDYQSKNELIFEEIVKLGIDICTALESCENKRIIHRDIKPENIFLSDDGRYELGDFGIARELEKTTGGLSKKGTYSYMAPEIYLGKPYNSTVDIYSLGIMLYKLLNHNRAPFLPEYPDPITFNDREKSLQSRMNGDEIPDIKDIPEELNNAVKKACAFDAKDRYQTASEMKEALFEVLNTEIPTSNELLAKEEPETAERTVGPFSVAGIPIAENTSENEKEIDEIESTVSAFERSESNSFEKNKIGNKLTALNEDDNRISQNINQPSQPQKKKLSKGALVAIVTSSLLVIIIAIVAVVLSVGNYNNYYYDYDDEEDFISILRENLVFDDDFSYIYPAAIISDGDEIAWFEYNDDFTKYRVYKVESRTECCIRWYENSEFKDLSDVNYYPKRYELTNEEYFETEDLGQLTYGYYHDFEISSHGYIDHVESYDSEYNIEDNWDDYCDYYGQVIEQMVGK